MKILHVTPMYFPAFKYGGPSVSIHILNKSLVKKGIEVSVMTTIAGLENVNDIKKNKWIDLDGVKVKYFSYYFKDNYTFSPQMLFECLKEAKNCDLVHITMLWHFQAWIGSLAAILNEKPYLICPAGALSYESINSKSRFIKRFYFNLIARHYLTKASAIMYNSEDERNKANDFYKFKNRSIVIPSGVDLEEFRNLPLKESFKNKYPILKSKKYILFLGRIHKKKGIDLLIEAFYKLSKDYDDLFLVIAGPDNDGYKREVQNLLNSKLLLDKILFTGVLSGKDKISAYVDSEVFVLPSYSENFALAVVEAMAAETPVVISNKVGICKEIEENNAGMVVDLNTQNLYQGIKKLLDNSVLIQPCVKNAKDLVKERYDVNKVVDMMIEMYENVLMNYTKTSATLF